MRTGRRKFIRILTLVLAFTLGTCTPASASFFGWLFGAEEESVETSAEVTLPPADSLQLPAEAQTQMPTLEPAVTLAPTPAPIPDAQIEDDGMLRVELRSLDAPQQLHLTLSGVYAVEGDPGFRFDRDARVTLSAAGDSVYLAVGGLTIDMGNSVALTRHAVQDGAENGLYIDESEKDTLYCGDLTVRAVEGNALRAVLRIQIEEYLYGVVAYEMSDSFPIDALKAQAVAARTYAMQRKWLSKGRDYDVADTTADQVFKGFDAEYANVIQAVDATRGVVGLFDGTFAICYYTASNGGQTALPSQVFSTEGGDGYLAMVDDPYDLENPKSLQNEVSFTASCEDLPKLRAMLETALGDRLRDEGYGDGEWSLDSIASIEPVDPRFEGSRMYDGLRFALRARLLMPVATPTPEATETPRPEDTAEPDETRASDALAEALIGDVTAEPTGTPTPPPTQGPREWVLSDALYDVTLEVYDQIKDGLSLGLNGADYELIWVETERDAAGVAQRFTLIMRRFGHGVGMSQRGAQWMAGHYGMYWQDILAFYYPGMSVERMKWPEAALTDLAALPDSVGAARPKPTPTPTPAPLPALKAGERYATVTANSLNVRERPTTAARAVDQLAKGRRVIVSGEPDADGWVPIHTAELTGFVKEEYLEYSGG